MLSSLTLKRVVNLQSGLRYGGVTQGLGYLPNVYEVFSSVPNIVKTNTRKKVSKKTQKMGLQDGALNS